MDYDIKLDSTYLSTHKYKYGVLVSCTIVFLCIMISQFYWANLYGLKGLLSANPEFIFKDGQWWRLFSTLFVHADLEHLLSNSFMLFILMFFVTTYYGLFAGTFLSLIMGGVTNYFVLMTFKENINLVGISGVIYYLWGFWFSLYVFIEKKYSLFRRVLNVGSIFFILLIPTTYSPTTSYLSHYLGFSIGLVTGAAYYPFKEKYFSSFLSYKIQEVPIFEEDSPN